MTFRVGQEVTPIQDIPRAFHADGTVSNLPTPVRGQVYRITWIGTDTCPHQRATRVWLELSEFPGLMLLPEWFRPVVKPKREASTETGMKLLREIAVRETLPSERERLKRRKAKVPAGTE